MRREVKYKIKGMNKDSSFSAFSPEFSFENRNIRITTLEGNTTLSIVNEKGTKLLNITGDFIDGKVIGNCVVSNNLVLFSTTVDGDDYIYLITEDNGSLNCKTLYDGPNTGNLNFSINHPIETLGIYENEDNIKVYWVDGINQPRVINIKDTDNLNDNSFDFSPSINRKFDLSFEVSKNYSSGNFPSGVIQYCFTYFNKNKQETNIIEVSPLYYTSNSDRGEDPSGNVANSFNISLKGLDDSFQYVRIYSILRTSLNATPLCKVVADLTIEDSKVSIIDTGFIGYTIDPTELLYVGGEVIRASTLNQKDNTLFLGNISVEKFNVGDLKITNNNKESKLKDILSEDSSIKFIEGDPIIINSGSTGSYPYINQLNKSSRDIKVFKYNECYRLGLQFQHKSGKWSSPIWMRDLVNDINPKGKYNTKEAISVTTGKPKYTLEDNNIIQTLLDNDYIAVRPVVVYPTDNDRSCICQGVLNPTVYNVGDRYNGTTFSQASWFFRPNLSYNIGTEDWKDFDTGEDNSFNSIGGVVTTKSCKYINSLDVLLTKDAWAEFRHNYFIPHNGDTRAEIQNIEQYPIQKVKDSDITSGWANYDIFTVKDEVQYLSDDLTYALYDINIVKDFPELYAVDQSTVTLNSPDIEFGNITQNILDSGIKLRYVGFIPITGNLQDIDVISSTPARSDSDGNIASGFYKYLYPKDNVSRLAGRRKLADFHWEDYSSSEVDGEENKLFYFNTYPWHREGSLNDDSKDSSTGYRTAELQSQKRSNLFFSTNSCYLSTPVDNPNYIGLDITTPKLFNASEDTILRLDTPNGSTIDSLIYRGNVDSLSFTKFVDIPEDFPSADKNVVRKKNGYYISRSLNKDGTASVDRVKLRFTDDNPNGFRRHYSKDPVSIKYKSTPHIVFSYNYSDGLPVITMGMYDTDEKSIINNNNVPSVLSKTFWGDNYGWKQNSISINKDDLIAAGIDSSVPEYSWLWLVELYRDVPNEVKFGGTSDSAIEANSWVVSGNTYSLETDSPINIIWNEGDHYYQRYDCLKTYPYTLEDTNSVVEILSFMCETRVNLDGRYDRNRGKTSNLVMTPNNFNLMNSVYDQQNNFFNYRVAEKQYQEIDDYLNAITWSKTKTFGEKIDTWTNITLASILELDGNKGRVESIKRLNNDLIAFQERGISQILYNDNIQISTQSGVPVEIANSGKVQGKRYLSSYIGCNNKWSVCESPAGLYFIDDNTKGIYLFNGNLINLSDKLGFNSWTKNNLKENNFISYYDPIESEVLFLNDTECLTYSEKLGAFTSFYDYTSNTIPINMGNRTLLVGDPLRKSTLKFYEYHAGKYNDFYGEFEEKNGETVYKPNFKKFSVELIVNPEPTKDKIFSTVEFRADAFDAEGKYLGDVKPFSNIQVKNEYQDTGDILLEAINLRKKFRIWRHTIQRDKDNKRDRIRNPWATITLKNKNPMANKVVLHDVVISYFD